MNARINAALRQNANLKSQEGFSMVEVIVGFMVLMVGLLSTASVLIAAASHQKISATLTMATNLAQEKGEEIRAERFMDVASETEDWGTIANYTTFKRVVTVTPNAENTLKTVQIAVTHLNGQRVIFNTYLSR